MHANGMKFKGLWFNDIARIQAGNYREKMLIFKKNEIP